MQTPLLTAQQEIELAARRIIASGSGGLPSRLPFGREVFSPIIVRSQAGLGDATAGGVFGYWVFFRGSSAGLT